MTHKKQKPNHSQQETQAKGRMPISAVAESATGKYAKKSVARHNPADNHTPNCNTCINKQLEAFTKILEIAKDSWNKEVLKILNDDSLSRFDCIKKIKRMMK